MSPFKIFLNYIKKVEERQTFYILM